MKFIGIQSSMLAVIGYDLYRQRLVVQFKNEKYYQYDKVPADIVSRIIFAESPGGVFTTLVKGEPVKYPFKAITAEEAHNPSSRR